MKQYPIWNIVTACIYKSGKSYGVKERGEVEVRVGTSKSNSHLFVNHRTTHKILENGDREYRLFVDDKCIKRAILPKNKYEIEFKAPSLKIKEDLLSDTHHHDCCCFSCMPNLRRSRDV